MKILITGASGFLGRNLIDRLQNSVNYKYEIYSFGRNSNIDELNRYTSDCEFVFNFAAVHRPKNPCEFDRINHLFFAQIVSFLEKNKNNCPVVYTSSIQATNGTDYGNSKIAAENELLRHAQRTGSKAIIYRLTNTYGRWATPNHHSVVATFCYNISRGIPIEISDREHIMHFYYIDDVIESFVTQMHGIVKPDEDGFYRLGKEKEHVITLGKLADTLCSFEEALSKGNKPNCEDSTEATLLKTYLSYRDSI